MQIEVDPAKGTRVIALAEDDRDVFIERDAVPELRAAAFVGFDGFVHQRDQRGLEIVGNLVDTNDVSLVRFESVRNLGFERFNSHACHSRL